MFATLVVSSVLVMGSSPTAATGTTTRVSVASDGVQANGASFDPPAISADGRYVAFISSASNLVPNDTNSRSDAFLHDRVTGTTTRVNVTSAGAQMSSNFALGGDIDVSADGGHVAFLTNAPLVPGDTNNTYDAFVHDVANGITARVSVASNEAQASAGANDVSISGDGSRVAFISNSLQLVSSDLRVEVFVRDRVTGTTLAASPPLGTVRTSGSANAPAISGDGRYVSYFSTTLDLVPNDVNGHGTDVFLRDLATASTRLVSVSSEGVQPETGESNSPSVSEDGRFVTFRSTASTLVPGDGPGSDVFLRDTQEGSTTRVSVGNGTSGVGTIENQPSPVSADGRYVAFASARMLAPGGAPGSFDVYVRDLVAASTSRVSLNGAQPTFSSHPAMSDNGRYVAFLSFGSALVAGDTNGRADIFVHDRVVDDTAPQVTPVLDPPAPDGVNGWYRTDIALDWLVTDPESPTETIGCAGAAITVDQPKTAYDCTASSAGGTTGPVSVVIGRDATPPTVEANVHPTTPDGEAGWYVTAPTVSYACSDSTSGVDVCPSPTSVDEGAQQHLSATATDLAGNAASAAAGPFDVDLTNPELECATSPTLGLNEDAQVTALVHDATSGPATPTVSAAADTSTVGTHEVTLTAHDLAGRSTTQTCVYDVVYEFSGFTAPVNPADVNVARDGSTIPLKWRITDHHGTPVTDLATVRVTASTTPCDLGTSEDLVEETAAGASGLQNHGDGSYQFNWKIPREYADSCKTVSLHLGDGANPSAQFRIAG